MQSTSSRTPSRSSRDRLVRVAVTLGVFGLLSVLLLNVPGQRYSWHTVWRDGPYGQYLVMGIFTTLGVSLGAMLVGLVLGVLGALARMSRNVVLDQLGTLYVELVRGTPLLVQLYVAYWCIAVAIKKGLLSAGIPEGIAALTDEAMLVGILTLGLFAGAYVAEIVRAAVESIHRGQTEAALSQGMTKRQTFWLVLLPQALRRMLPPLAGQFVSLIKDSSLLSIIGVMELTKRADEVRSPTLATFEVFLPLALLYLALTFPLSWVTRRLELRLQ